MNHKPDVEKQGILFVCKAKGFDASYERDIQLIYMDEILATTDLSKVQDYGYEFVEQSEALSFWVADTDLTQKNILFVISSSLYEMSFWGFEQERLKEELERIDQVFETLEEHPEKSFKISDDDWFDEVETFLSEDYPDEKTYLKKCEDADLAYNQYCRNMELLKIKERLEDTNEK